MTRTTGTQSPPETAELEAAWRVSVLSVAWTLVTSAIAVALGIHSHTIVLVALGAVGFVDAIGSVTLAVHFRDALQNEELSPRLEHLAHVVVLVCLAVVGAAAVVAGTVRLVRGQGSDGSVAGAVLAASSVVVLTVLARRKVRIARLVGSEALRSDGHLSALGASEAGVALLGTAATEWLSWSSADAAATVLLGLVAVALAGTTWLRRD